MSKLTEKWLERYYSDERFNGTATFYKWLREGLQPSHRVLNLGAGPPATEPERILKGEVREVVGADIDPVVLSNPQLDRGVLIENDRILVDDSYFDLVFSDNVLEHVEKPAAFLTEVHRLLKPGGKFMFRTPNYFHYVAIGASLTPQWFHEKVANKMRRMDADAHEPWPTFYRMNTGPRLRTLGKKAGFGPIDLRFIECEPSYLVFHPVPFLFGMAYERAVNATPLLQGLRATIQGSMTKKGSSQTA